MGDAKLDVGINFNVSGNAEAAGALNALGTAAAETAAEFDAAAVSAKAMADAVTGAQALSQLGIKAKAPGVVDTEGHGLVTVAAEEQANAQNILNKLGLEATAVTSEQAAATARLAEASVAAAAGITEQAAATTEGAAAAGRLAVAETEAGSAGIAMREEASGATSAFGGMWTQLIAVIAALEAYNKAKEFISTGIEFNTAIESARLGIAASVNAMADLTTAQGRALEGQEKFGAATAIADDQIQKLFADSARTSTTVQQLVTTYQRLIAVGLNANANLDQIRQLTTDAALAAGAMNVPFTQLSTTLVQLLSGHTRVTNQMAQQLHIKQADLTLWQQQGTLVTNLLAEFAKYESLSSRVQGTWAGITSNVKEFFQQFTGSATSGAFTTLETGIKGQLGRVFDFDTGKLSSNIEGAASLLREGLGGGAQLIVDLVGKIVSGLEEMGTWFENNRAEAEAMGRNFVEMVKNTGQILLDIVKIVGGMVAWAANSLAVQTSLRTIADILGFIAGPFGAIVAAAGALVLVLSNAAAIGGAATGIVAFIAALNPVTLTIGLVVAAITTLVAITEHHNLTQERAAAAIAATSQRQVEHAKTTADLVHQYEALSKEIAKGKLEGEQLSVAQARLKSVTDELIKLSPAYKDALTNETTSLGEKTAAVEKLHAAEIAELKTKADAAFSAEIALNAQTEAAQEHLNAIEHTRPFLEVEDARSKLADLKTELAAARTVFAGAEGALEAASKKPDELPGVKPKKIDEPKGEKGLDEAESKARIEAFLAQVARIKTELDGQLSRNEISYADYFDRLNSIELQALEVQIAEKTALLNKTHDPKEQAKLSGDIAKLQEEETETVEKNAAKRAQLEQQYDKQRTAIAIQNLKDQGEAELAYDLQFEEAHRALVARATVEGDAATLAAIDNEYAIGKARMEADKAAKQAQGVTSDTEGTVRGVQAGVENGAISEARGRDLIIAAYQRERAAIEAALAAAEALAKISPTPDNIAKVDTLAKQYGTVEKEIAKASDTSLHLRRQIAGELTNDLTEFFTRTIEGAHSVGEAFGLLAESVIKSIQSIISQLLAAQITKGIAGLLGLGGSSIAGASLGDISNAGISHLASGGHVSGAGGPTSDSIPAMLSNGEYVVRASAVADHGVQFFDAINAGSLKMRAHAYGGIARFAEGGAVGFAGGGSVNTGGRVDGATPHAGGTTHIHVTHDPGVILDVLDSPEAHKITIGVLAKNPKAARQAQRISSG